MAEQDKPVANIAVLIVAYRSRDTIPACLQALAEQTVRPAEVWLLENGSPQGERVDVACVPDWVNFVESDENLGFAAGNNRLAEKSDQPWIACLNPDAFARSDWIAELAAATEAYPGAALFGSTQYAAGSDGVMDGLGDVYHAAGLAYRAGYGLPLDGAPPEGEVFGPCAAASLVRRDVFEELEGFDEDLFCYNEDVDLAYRARLKGYRAVQLSRAIVDHMGYGSSGRRSEFATYYGVRNRIWVFLKNTPGWLFPLMLPAHVGANLLLLLSSARFGQFRVFWRAVRHGFGGWQQMMKSRRAVQSERRVTASQIAAIQCWSPVKLLSRTADVRDASTLMRDGTDR